jgi:hypothetical protein
MMPVALFSLFIRPKKEDPPKRGRPKRPIINHAPLLFLSLLPKGKGVNNHN